MTTNPPTKCECGAPLFAGPSGFVCSECDRRIKPFDGRIPKGFPRIEHETELEDAVCETCDGTDEIDCSECDGSGTYDCPTCGTCDVDCDECDGTGKVECPDCEGKVT